MTSINELLAELARAHFYGTVEVKLEAGKVVLVRKTETIKPLHTNCRDNRGKHYERN